MNARSFSIGLMRGALSFAVVTACDADQATRPQIAHAAQASAPRPSAAALSLVLAQQGGEHPLDVRIRALQQRVVSSRVPARELEPLGWAFIARARELMDAGAYNLALQTALAIEDSAPNEHAAALLRGHALHGLHRFADAERVARRLVEERGLPVDHGLLGDILVDRGDLEGAVENYQRMMDQRPDMQAYARAAHVRYLKGDLPGALEAMRLAARAASPRSRESFAWVWAKLAEYELRSGLPDNARDSVSRALEVFGDSFQAQRTSGLIWLAREQPAQAVAPLQAAMRLSPHPEVAWMLLEALEALGRKPEAERVQAQLLRQGATEDARAFALFLASRKPEQLALAEELAQRELTDRADAYSHEAVAWVASARGQHAAALQHAERSLAAGTPDARLLYHAAVIAQRAGDSERARRWVERATPLASALLPSQRRALSSLLSPRSE